MKEQLEQIYANAVADLSKAASISDLDEIRGKYLSRKGEFNEIKKNLKNLSDEDKRIVGSLANEITQKLEASLKEKHDEFYKQELDAKLLKERIDITLPGKFIPRGKVHPITSTTNEIVSSLQSLGFSVVPDIQSPEVETDYYNFDALNVPKDHPARDVQDTFYTTIAKNIVLRSQTSGAQIHAMEGQKPPISCLLYTSDAADD